MSVALHSQPALPAAPVGLTVRVFDDGGDACIALHGELDLVGVPELRAALRTAEAGPAEAIVLDLSELAFMDGAGLAVVLATHRRLDDGRPLLLHRGRRCVQRVFELAGADEGLYFLD